MLPRSLVEAHRRDVHDLVRLAQNDLYLILQRYTDPELARDALMIAVPKLVDIYGAATATLGADWYAELRDAAGAFGRFTPITATLPDAGRTDALVRWGLTPMFSAEPDRATAFSDLSGGLQRIIANADRQTITVSSIEDRQARGWVRSTSGGCDFCEGLTGITFDTEPDFECHDHCRCVAVPEFG